MLDFATSNIAQGKTRVAYNKGVELQAGHADRRPRRADHDPALTVRSSRIGALLPFGEHKGYGLALICELLGGALAGGATGPVTDGRRRVLNSMFSVIVDAGRLGTAANLAQEMESFVAWSTASPSGPGVERVLTPGEPERAYKAERLVPGVPVDSVTWAEIVEAGSKVGLTAGDIEALARRR